MDRSFEQLREVQSITDCPVIVAGDIFDRWNAPAELINFAIDALPKCDVYAVAGQHDLPNHNYDDIERSAYWTLVQSKALRNLAPGSMVQVRGMVLHGFPWGCPVQSYDPESTKFSRCCHVAVCHSFIYNDRTGYKGAPTEQKQTAYKDRLRGYHAAVFGDNHKGFLSSIDSEGTPANLLNCGTFMRRKADEISYKPTIGLLHAGGSMTRVLLDTSDDEFVALEEALELVESVIDMTDFAGALAALGKDGLSFVDAVKKFLDRNSIADNVRQRVMEAVASGEDRL